MATKTPANDTTSANGTGPRGSHPIDAFVGRKLTERRLFVGIDREEMARRLGVTARRLERYESGREAVPAEILARAGVTLRVPVDSFFPPMTAAAQADRLPLSEEEVRRLADYFDRCPPEVRRRLLATARETASQSAEPTPGS